MDLLAYAPGVQGLLACDVLTGIHAFVLLCSYYNQRPVCNILERGDAVIMINHLRGLQLMFLRAFVF